MKIINKETGKRLDANGEDVKSINKKLKEEDPILRNADKEESLEEFSAMDPPNAYDNDKTVGLDYQKSDIFIQQLVDEHKEVITELQLFDDALLKFRETHFDFTAEMAEAFNKFFKYFDDHVLPHNRKEERDYFRILHDRFIESGEHGEGPNPNTPIDLMEDDHTKFIQLATLSFNLFGLAHRLRDNESRAITFDLAFNSGRELVELLRLHIYREDETLFPLSQKLLTTQDFEIINGKN